MSDKNEEIKTITFDNKIPVICMLSAQESQKDEEVFPLLLMIPRVHYISLYHSRVHNHFKKYLNNMVQLDDLYLSYNNTRIDWEVFFGVFFDTHFYEYSNNLPLRLQVNYRASKVTRDFSEKELFTYDLKQSSCIKYKNNAR